MTGHLLVISVGPVQDFISAARRTRDLWFGSHLLSRISQSVAWAVEQGGGHLIFPTSQCADREGVAIANVILAEMPPGCDVENVAKKQARKAAETCWRGFASEARQAGGDHHQIIFGAQEDAGHISFYDAWIEPECLRPGNDGALALDVMTPHHGGYYAGSRYEAGPNRGELMAPTDFDDPNPIVFLTVTGVFVVAVRCDVESNQGQRWASLALHLLRSALSEWGVGGKTSSGYGRLVPEDRLSRSILRSSGTPATASSVSMPKYSRGACIRVKRVERDGKVGFLADDGLWGHFISETPPSDPSFDTWVANVGAQTCTFTMRPPKRK